MGKIASSLTCEGRSELVETTEDLIFSAAIFVREHGGIKRFVYPHSVEIFIFDFERESRGTLAMESY